MLGQCHHNEPGAAKLRSHLLSPLSPPLKNSEGQGQKREKENRNSSSVSSVLILTHARAHKPTDDFMFSSSASWRMLQAGDKRAAFNILYTANSNYNKRKDAFSKK